MVRSPGGPKSKEISAIVRALFRTRTGDPFLTIRLRAENGRTCVFMVDTKYLLPSGFASLPRDARCLP
jgi:hypothetical protein